MGVSLECMAHRCVSYLAGVSHRWVWRIQHSYKYYYIYIVLPHTSVLTCAQVYTLTLRVCHVPPTIIESYKPYIGNMLGLVRGNIYYNLMNWYRYVSCMPVGDSAKFMETMMGVKQTLEPELEAELGLIRDTAPKYSCITKLKVIHRMLYSSMLTSCCYGALLSVVMAIDFCIV